MCRDCSLTLSHLSGHQGGGFPGTTIALAQFFPQADDSRVRIWPPVASPPPPCTSDVLRSSSAGTFPLQEHHRLVAVPGAGQQHTR